MLCPHCNAEVTEARFCENCGATLPVEAAAAPSVQTEQPTSPTVQPQQPAGQTTQPGDFAPTPPSAPTAPEPSNAPFVLAIIALVTAILGMAPISIVLAIIALVMNSGQKKRGEFSSKQTPTTVMSVISIVVSVIVTLIIAFVIGIIGVAAVNSGFDDHDSSTIMMNAPSSSSNSTGTETSTPIATTDDLVGKWKLSKLVQNGSATGTDELEMMQSMGLEVSLNLSEDGSATLVLFGAKMEGTWEASDPHAATLVLVGQRIPCTINADTGELSFTEGGDELTFAKA